MTAQDQLDRFIDRFTPAVAAPARRALAMVAARLPGATRLVHDNYNALAIGFGPDEHAGAITCSIARCPRRVSLFPANGATRPDPRGLLEGGGARMRHHVKLNDALIDDLAVTRPIDPAATACVVIRSISAGQRPRRP